MWVTPLDEHGEQIGNSELVPARITTYSEGVVWHRFTIERLWIQVPGEAVLHTLRLHSTDIHLDHSVPLARPARFHRGGGSFEITEEITFGALREAPQNED